MKKYLIIGGASVAVLVAVWTIQVREARAPGEETACTAEAKLCPDGSAVGRTGPNCEFSACPSETASSTTDGGGSILPYNSGVSGTVLLGPTCPVERIPPDPSCAPKAYATAIVVYRINSNTPFVLGNSDATGTFKFSLPPGSYTLKTTSGALYPRCNPVNVTVDAVGYAAAAISCDTGIR